jgi:predicted ATP-dependent protease
MDGIRRVVAGTPIKGKIRKYFTWDNKDYEIDAVELKKLKKKELISIIFGMTATIEAMRSALDTFYDIKIKVNDKVYMPDVDENIKRYGVGG